LVPSVDIRRLPIGPQEAFVMSRIDGSSSIRDIGYSTGIPEEQVEQCLDTLERLGAIDYAERPYGGLRVGLQPSAGGVSGFIQRSDSPIPVESTTLDERDGSAGTTPTLPVPAYPTTELESPCDLALDRRREILQLYYQLETLDYYRLLDVTVDADRKTIKSAYYERVKVYHPDRYYGKNLGDFRVKLEKCFARLTAAYETLSSVDSRAEYDNYLQSQRQVRELEESLNQSVTVDDLEILERRLIEAVNPRLPSQPSSSIETGSALYTPSSRPPTSSNGPTSSCRQMTEDERKKALARKLRPSQMNLRAVAPRSSVPPPAKEQLAEQLKRQHRYATSLGQLQNLLTDAEKALESGDPVRATNALRAAQTLAPQDPQIAERLAQAQGLASMALASTYLKQAEYEEKSGRLEAAARSYERAARGVPQATTWEAAARCLLGAGGDLRTASDFAKKAIALAPEQPSGHIILGRIFVAAQMRSSAITELERARSLAPNDDTVSALLNRLERERL
jgi:curved DNA-binding protein CbpA